MTVHVHGDLNLGVPELLRYIGQRYPATEHQTRIRVVRIVDPDMADLSLLKKWAPDTIPEPRVAHELGRICRRRKHPLSCFRGYPGRSLRILIPYPIPDFRNGSRAPAIATRYAIRSTLFWIFPDIAPSFSKRTPPVNPPAKLPTAQTSHNARMRFPWK